MSKASNIDSLTELHERQAEVKKETKLARQGLVDSLAQAPGKVKKFAYEDLAIPVMGIGLAAYVGYRLLRSGNRPQKNIPAPAPQPLPLPPVGATEKPPIRNQALLPAPRPVSPPRQDVQENNAAKSGLSLAAIISVGRLLIPAAQAIMGAVQDHKANQENSKKVVEQENLPSVTAQEA